MSRGVYCVSEMTATLSIIVPYTFFDPSFDSPSSDVVVSRRVVVFYRYNVAISLCKSSTWHSGLLITYIHLARI